MYNLRADTQPVIQIHTARSHQETKTKNKKLTTNNMKGQDSLCQPKSKSHIKMFFNENYLDEAQKQELKRTNNFHEKHPRNLMMSQTSTLANLMRMSINS